MSTLTASIEERVASQAGLSVIAEENGESVVLSGLVESDELRQVALDIASEAAGGRKVEDNLEVMDAMAAELGSGELSETEIGMFAGAAPGLEEEDALSAVDFTDQKTLVDPMAASGPSGMEDDDVSEGGHVYVPPVDPVGTNTEVIGGFQADSMEHIEVERSALDGQLGDEAIADAVRRELREDSATTALEIRVDVENGIVRLRGTVADLDDVENAEAVASIVPGVLEVREELKVEGM